MKQAISYNEAISTLSKMCVINDNTRLMKKGAVVFIWLAFGVSRKEILKDMKKVQEIMKGGDSIGQEEEGVQETD